MPAPEPATLAPEQLPFRFGRYELLSVLGEGGMGRVYEADLIGPAGFRKRVALKVLKAAARDLFKELAREARLGGLMSHPNVVDTFDLGEQDRVAYVAMELVRGPTLSGLIRAGGALPPRAALELILQVASGLSHAHRLQVGEQVGLVHRDLKPANILLTPEGLVKVADFGIAVLAGGDRPTSQSGTPGYMSPEQVDGAPLDGRTDLFALGMVSFDVFTGRRLISGKGVQRKMMLALRMDQMVQTEAFRAPLEAAIPGLADEVARCVRVSADDRWPTVADFAQALKNLPLPDGLGLADVLAQRGLGTEGGEGFASLGTGSVRQSTADTRPPRAPTNLGADSDPFIGRERELVALRKWLDSDGWLALLKGPGGAGKTRLSRHFGRTCAPGLEGGTWFADLSECSGAEPIAQALAAAMSLPASGDPAAQALAALASRGPSMVILDNAEQIVAEVAALVKRIRAEAPEVRVLVTSRERLKVRGEHVIPLGELELDDAIALFHDRAEERGWQPQDGDEVAVKKLVKRLDRMPLAIELAAARCRMMPVTTILARLEDRFAVLRGGQRGGPKRQASLHAAIEGSWDVLEPWEQSVLAQCAVFVGGFSLEAAEEVVELSDFPDAGWVMDAVESLLDRSLIVAEPGPTPRFRTYESIRAFAVERLRASGSNKEASAWRRHALYFSRYGSAEQLTRWRGPAALQVRQELIPEVDNLVVALRRTISLQDSGLAVPLARATGTALGFTGPWLGGRKLLTKVRTAMRLDPSAWLAVARHEGSLAYRTADTKALDALVTAANALPTDGMSPQDHVTLGMITSFLTVLRGQWDKTNEALGRALVVAEAAGLEHDVAEMCRSLGVVSVRQGRLDDARAFTERALALSQSMGDRMASLVAGINAASLEKENGDIRRSADLFAEMAREAHELGERRYEAMSVGNLALVQFEGLGRQPAAIDSYRRAIRLNRSLGARGTEALMRSNYGFLLTELGRFDEAGEQLAQALQIAEAMQIPYVRCVALVNRANHRLKQGQVALAAESSAAGLALANEIKTPTMQGAANHMEADIAAERGELDEAERLIVRAMELCGEDIIDGTRAVAAGARIALLREDWAAAEERIAAVAARVERYGLCRDSPSAMLLARLRFDLQQARL